MDCLGSPTTKSLPGWRTTWRQWAASGSRSQSRKTIWACSGSVSWNSSTSRYRKRCCRARRAARSPVRRSRRRPSRSVKSRRPRLTCTCPAQRDRYAEYVTGLAVAVADSFARWAGHVQVSLGRLDFTDLLGRLRDLLTGDLAARRALQQRFRYLLVDEFQDTDPLQAEIVFLLCEREPRAVDWREVVLKPGKLFVVGAPKQSIYRFRRADIALYDQVKRLVEGQPDGTGVVTAIRQNFRTTPAAAGWVNNVFAPVFDDDQGEGRQPRYQWVEPCRPPAEGPRIAVLLGREYGFQAGEADAARLDEARALAALLLRMHGADAERWSVQDRGAGVAAAGGAPPRPR